MTRTKSVNGKRVDLTAKENAARDLEEAAVISERAEAESAKATRDLSRAEFNGMLAAKGLDAIWTSMQSALTGAAGEDAEELRFQLAANLHATFYNLDATLILVAQFRGLAATVNADYAAMLTDDSITTAWRATVARLDGGTA